MYGVLLLVSWFLVLCRFRLEYFLVNVLVLCLGVSYGVLVLFCDVLD